MIAIAGSSHLPDRPVPGAAHVVMVGSRPAAEAVRTWTYPDVRFLKPTQRAFTKLRQSYDFTTASVLSDQWAVYNSAWSGDPYARDPRMVTVSNGALHVATKGMSGSGLCLCKNGGSPRLPYGRWDVRARAGFSSDHGFALMLWPNAENWPVGGEIDLAEFPTGKRSAMTFTVHYGANNQQIHDRFSGNFTQWHTYSVEWLPSGIRYWLDGVLRATITLPAAIPTGSMHLAIQAGTDPRAKYVGPTGASFDVAWVKTYQ